MIIEIYEYWPEGRYIVQVLDIDSDFFPELYRYLIYFAFICIQNIVFHLSPRVLLLCSTKKITRHFLIGFMK